MCELCPMDYHQHKKHESNFLSLTSLTVTEFEHLFYHFEPLWEKYYRYHTLEGKKRIIVSYQEHGNALLKGTQQKLFFLLVYMKSNPLQTFQAASFGLSQPKVSKIYRALLAVLDDTLKKMGLSPCRDSYALKQVLATHKNNVFWLDGTETIIQRNSDKDAQEEDFSGKQHGHRLKNLTICDSTQKIWYLSPTESGSMHDKTLADLYPIELPIGSVLKQDLGFMGHSLVGVIIEQPFKKPHKQELDFSKKIYNKIFSSTRIVIEHANSGLKRLRMLKDVLRVHNSIIRDTIRVIACGLHNLRVRAIDPVRNYQNSPRGQAYFNHFSE
jgi:hypothetical protein